MEKSGPRLQNPILEPLFHSSPIGTTLEKIETIPGNVRPVAICGNKLHLESIGPLTTQVEEHDYVCPSLSVQ
jgi:hypothetical protein